MRHRVAIARVFSLLFIASVGWPASLVTAVAVRATAVDSNRGSMDPAAPLDADAAVPPAPVTLPDGGAGSAIARDPSIGEGPRFSPHESVATRTELPDARTERTRTYANPDGSYTTQVTQGRFNFADPTGAWQPLDLHLVRDPAAAYDVRVTANDRMVHFGTDSADEALGQIGASTGIL
jgi:hypothetical protein